MENVGSHFILLNLYLMGCFPSVQTADTQTGCYFSGISIPLGTNITLLNTTDICHVYICKDDGTGCTWVGYGEECDGNQRIYPTYGPGCVISGIVIPLGTNKTLLNTTDICHVYICKDDGTGYTWEGYGEECGGNQRIYPTYGPGCVISGIVIPLGTNKTLLNTTDICHVYICKDDGTGYTWEGYGEECGGNQRIYPTYGPGCVISGIVIPLGTNKTLLNTTDICHVYICKDDGTGYTWEGYGEECGGNQRIYPTYGPGCVISGIVIPLGTNKTLLNTTDICHVYICNGDGTGYTWEGYGEECDGIRRNHSSDTTQEPGCYISGIIIPFGTNKTLLNTTDICHVYICKDDGTGYTWEGNGEECDGIRRNYSSDTTYGPGCVFSGIVVPLGTRKTLYNSTAFCVIAECSNDGRSSTQDIFGSC